MRIRAAVLHNKVCDTLHRQRSDLPDVLRIIQSAGRYDLTKFKGFVYELNRSNQHNLETNQSETMLRLAGSLYRSSPPPSR